MSKWKEAVRRNSVWLMCFGILSCGTGTSKMIPATSTQTLETDSGAPFGTGCQQTFENNWQAGLSHVWAECSRWNSRFSAVADFKWYYNLNGGKGWWQQPSGYGNNLDTVNFFYGNTHGGAFNGTAAYAMWNQNSLAYTSSMRLRNNLDVLSTSACQTLKADNQIVSRWLPVMRGGLRYVTGSYNTIYDSWWTEGAGESFANNMAHAHSIRSSWFDGFWNLFIKNDVAVMTVGSNSSECFNRLGNMTAQNRLGFPRRKDGAIGYMCWTTHHE